MRASIVKNFIWRLMERSCAQLVTLAVSIVLARILDPETYGTVGIVLVFMSLGQTFIDSGLGNALIQKEDASSEDFSTVFYVNVFLCIVLYIIMWLAAPIIAYYFNNDALIKMLRVISLIIVISAFKNIQQAYVARNMMFRKFFYATLGGTIIAGIVGIGLAYSGAGAWALIVQQLMNNLIDMLILWVVVGWRPTREFSLKSLKELFSYGWKLTIGDFVDKLYNEIRDLIIGKKYTKADLAFFSKGKLFPNLLISNVNASLDSVLFPAMSDVQNDEKQVKELVKKSIVTSTFLLFPMLLGLASCAEVLIKVVLGNRWIQCVPYLRIFCIVYMFHPIHTANLNAIKSLGRSDLYLKIEVIKKLIGVIILILTYKYGPIWIAIGMLGDAFTSLMINIGSTKRLIGYGILSQCRDLIPNIINTSIMVMAVISIGFMGLNAYLELFIKIIVGIVTYCIMCIVTKNNEWNYYLIKIRELKR